MLEAIGSGFPASQAANAVISSLSRGERGRGAAATRAPESPSPTQSLGGKSELTEEELREVDRLKKRDAEVRRHEQAHKAAAGRYATGGPTYEYEKGPDGRQYAVGGEVQIDVSPVEGDPQATIQKMQQVRRAALAPAEPSAQDRKVAAEAARLEAQARAELSQGDADEQSGSSSTIRTKSGSTSTTNAGGRSDVASAYASQEPFIPAGRFIDVAA